MEMRKKRDYYHSKSCKQENIFDHKQESFTFTLSSLEKLQGGKKCCNLKNIHFQ